MFRCGATLFEVFAVYSSPGNVERPAHRAKTIVRLHVAAHNLAREAILHQQLYDQIESTSDDES